MNYRFAYSVGFHPWEDAISDPPFAEKIAEMFGRKESGRKPPALVPTTTRLTKGLLLAR